MIIKKNSSKTNDLDKILFKGKELSKTEKYLPIFGGVGIVLTLITVFIPTIKNIGKVRSDIEAANVKLGKIRDQRRIFENLMENEGGDSLNQNLSYAYKYLPEYKPSLEVLINISRLSRLKGVEFSGLTISIGTIKQSDEVNTKVDDKLKDFNLEFSVKGKKDSVLSFISEIKEISPIMKVTDVSTKFNEQQDLWDMKLKLRVFHKNSPETIPAIDRPITMISDEEVDLLESLNNYLMASSYFSDLDQMELDVVYGVPNPFE